jgi:hypothetical protein|tara:strand:+ start:309 stop:701 length:393 start_codon:yes stop_codon:yes gene_type:complete
VVNASLNWSSIVGLILFFYGVLTAPLAIAQIFFTLQRRADTSPAVIAKSVVVFMQAAGRFFLLPLCGGILFFQGWRLDPILQFGQFLLAAGLIFESAPSIASDYQKWRFRTGRANAVIAGQGQPSDIVDE